MIERSELIDRLQRLLDMQTVSSDYYLQTLRETKAMLELDGQQIEGLTEMIEDRYDEGYNDGWNNGVMDHLYDLERE